MHDPELNPGKDLTDPKQLIQELKVIADGMGQQAAATSTGTALGGHSNPAWLYTHCADVARAAEVMITEMLKPVNKMPTTANPPVDQEPAGTKAKK